MISVYVNNDDDALSPVKGIRHPLTVAPDTRPTTAGGVPVLLLGLVLIADAPGRLPHALRQLAGLIAGGAPAVWSLPWIEAWRVGDPPGPANAPKVARRLLEDLQAMTEAPASVNANRIRED